MVDADQAVVWEGSQEPFGNVSVTTNTVGNNFRFPGQYFDTESGLHYNYHRYYDPSIGRYLRADPIGLVGMDPNLYGYVQNNPANLIDPEGLFTWVHGAAAALGATVNGINNWDAYQRGDLSTKQYLGSIAFGAGTGYLSALSPSFWGGVALGAITSAANNFNNQTITNDPCEGINAFEVFESGAIGMNVGVIGGSFTKMGKVINVPYLTGMQSGQVAGVMGNVFGTIGAK